MFPRLEFGLEYKMILVHRRPGQHFHLESKATRRPRWGESRAGESEVAVLAQPKKRPSEAVAREARLHMARGNSRKRLVYSGFVV
jgi:hypothetical protein